MTTTATKAYPGARPDRGDPIPSQSPSPGAPPIAGGANGRSWPFYIRRQGGAAIVVSPGYVGPAIIESITFFATTAVATGFPVVQLYVSDDNGGAGSALPGTTQPGGNPLFDPLSFSVDDATLASGTNGFLFQGITPGAGTNTYRIGRVIRKSTFFLKLLMRIDSGGGGVVDGVVNLYEAVPESVLANFR